MAFIEASDETASSSFVIFSKQIRLLDNLKVKDIVEMQGKVSDIKTKYRSEEYRLELENDTDMRKLMQAFPTLKQIDRNQLIFCESVLSTFDVLRFVSEQEIALLKFERVEPTLESLFMEVTRK